MLFLIFVGATLLETYVLILVGTEIGPISTILLIIITALIGSSLLKQQGWSTMAKAQKLAASGQTPALEMFEGLVILISGILLITPGFITDTLGLLGLMPFSRLFFIRYILSKNVDKFFKQKSTVFYSNKTINKKSKSDKDAIEGEFWED